MPSFDKSNDGNHWRKPKAFVEEAEKTGRLVLSREQLFAQVWATPTVRLARQFGISDVALAKLCRRRNIPRPPRGFWAKVAAGCRLPRPDLPPAGPGHNRVALFTPACGHAVVAPGSRAEPTVHRFPVVLPGVATVLHPLAQRLHRRLLGSKKDLGSIVRVDEGGMPVVSASPAQAGRVAGAWHVLLSSAPRRGYAVTTIGDQAPIFCCDAERLVLKIAEELFVPAGPTRTRSRPTGRLCFSLYAAIAPANQVWSQSEAAAGSLEALLEELLNVLASRSGSQRRPLAAPRPPARPEKDECARAQHRQRKFEHVAARRIRMLLDAAEAWQAHRQLAEYLSECEVRLGRRTPKGPTAEERDWLVWARSVAENLSPFGDSVRTELSLSFPSDVRLKDEEAAWPRQTIA